MKKYLRLNKKNIIKYKKENNWEGNGIEAHDPIIINSINPHYQKLKLKNLNRFIQISDLSLDYVYLTGCRNILIKECKFNQFNLTSCQRIEVRNNKLPLFILLFSRDNKILGNQISQEDYNMVTNNLGERQDNKKLSVVLGIMVALVFFTLSYGVGPFLYFYILVLGIIIYFKIRSRILIKRADTLPDNIFSNNIKIPTEI